MTMMFQYCQEGYVAFQHWTICGFLYMGKVDRIIIKKFPIMLSDAYFGQIKQIPIKLKRSDYNSKPKLFYIIIVDYMNTIYLQLIKVIISI